MNQRRVLLGVVLTLLSPAALSFGAEVAADAPFPTAGKTSVKSINALFLGNSYTGRHDLSLVVETMCESGVKGLDFKPTTVIYGGRVMTDHWEYRSQNWIRATELTADEQRKTRDHFAALAKKAPEHKFYGAATKRHEVLLELIESGDVPKWDLVILQSWRDTDEHMDSRYAEYVPRLAKLAHEQGARVLLYETAAGIQNAEALPESPDIEVGNASARFLGQLSKETGALVVPMTFIANRCQRARPDLTLRYVNDGHLNQTMSYMTACAFYAVLFDKSPVGLPVNEISDNKIVDKKKPENDPDGNPRRVVFDDETRLFLQKMAWESVQEYRAIAKDATK